MKKQALLVVSFGTSFPDSRRKAIDRLEEDLRKQFPERDFFHAYTSGVIRKLMKKNEQIYIPSVEEVMRDIVESGYEDLLVQPTHVIDGIENHQMKQDICRFQDRIAHIRIGEPLLTDDSDYKACAKAVMGQWLAEPGEDTVILFMGHGTSHEKNSCYERLNRAFHDEGYFNVYVGTVEALPDLEELITRIRPYHYKRVIIAPFMLVAGDHAYNDMAGSESDSWKCVLEKEGFEVIAHIVGLGELQAIRDIYASHARIAQSVQAPHDSGVDVGLPTLF